MVHSNPRILSGTPVFIGTRVPVEFLFDHLQVGDTLRKFLDQFPSVAEHQAVGVLQMARESVVRSARPV